MIRLDIPNMDETIRALTAPLQHMPKECESAVSRAINRTLNAMRAEAIRIARRAYVYVRLMARETALSHSFGMCWSGAVSARIVSSMLGMSIRIMPPPCTAGWSAALRGRLWPRTSVPR